MSLPKKRKSIDLALKLEIIEKVEQGVRQSKLCADYELNKSTVSGILANKGKYKALLETHRTVQGVKRMRSSEFPLLDDAVITWYSQMRTKGVLVTGAQLRENAKIIAEKMNFDKFTASQGWLDKFRKRHGLCKEVMAGEANYVSEDCARRWMDDVLPKVLQGWKPENVYTCGESGLLYKLLPNMTLAEKDDEVQGSTKSRERVTVMFCTNADGSDKFPLTVIGKQENPSCLETSKNLPVVYHGQKNAWMDHTIFRKWIQDFDDKMTDMGRKVILFMDNVSSHQLKDCHLYSTTVKLFPVNTTGKLQPLDQGIIEAFKKLYRTKLLKKFMSDINSNVETNTDLIDAVDMISKAWNEVTEKIVSSCFRIAGFRFNEAPPQEETQEERIRDTAAEDRHVWDFISQHLDIQVKTTFENYITCDSNLETDDTCVNEENPQEYITATSITLENEDCKTPSEALRLIRSLRSYCESRDIDAGFPLLNCLEDIVIRDTMEKATPLKQDQITDLSNQ